jgi:hypothetical protein
MPQAGPCTTVVSVSKPFNSEEGERMDRSFNLARIPAAASLVAGMALIWVSPIVHWAPTEPASAILADAQVHRAAYVVGAATDIASMICFGIAGVGIAAIVSGRGRTFALIAAAVMVLGLPSHVFGGVSKLVVVGLTESGVSPDVQAQILDELMALQSVYFALIVPFLLAMLLLPAALWRARAVTWVPLAMMLMDLFVVSQFTSSTTPSDWLWWIDPLVTVTAYGMLAVGLLRYRRVAHEAPPPLTVAPAAEPVVAA